MIRKIKQTVKRILPGPWLTSYAMFRFHPLDPIKVVAYVIRGMKGSRLGFFERFEIAIRFYIISMSVDCPHTQYQMLTILEAILSTREGYVVEAGCFKGGSTSKLSIGAKMAHKKLVVFDSFQGIPPNSEPHEKSIFGNYVGTFKSGSYMGTLDEVKRNIRKFGAIDVCEFVEGWFDQTLPNISIPISIIFLDVDLASSTRTSLKFLYPQLIPGGVLISHDGHLPLVINVFNDDAFWENEVRCPRPPVEHKADGLIIVTKPQAH
jgi:O-methyltransferase